MPASRIGTLAVLILAGVPLPRGVFVGAAIGSLLGFAFVNWLAFQSLNRIGALCPWCLVVWTVTPLILIWISAWALSEFASALVARSGRVLWDWRYLVVASWYLLVVVLILVRFWSYWRTLG